MACVPGVDRGWLFRAFYHAFYKKAENGLKNLNTTPMHGICTDQTTQKHGMKVRPSKTSAILHSANYANKWGAEGRPGLFA